MTNHTITPSQLAENLSDVVERLRRGGESFTLEVDGEAIADIAPASPVKKVTLHELFNLLDALGEPDEDFAADVREAREMQRPPRLVDWPS